MNNSNFSTLITSVQVNYWAVLRSLFTGCMLLVCSGHSFSQNVLSYQDAVKIALYNNFDVLIARNEAEILSNNNSAGNAGFLPVIDAGITQNLSILNTDIKFFTGESVERENAQSQSFGAFIQLNYTIFDGLRMFAAKSRLEELERLGQHELMFRMDVVATQVGALYYRIVQEQKFQDILFQSLAISNERLKLAEMRFRLGSASELEKLNALVSRNADSSAFLQQILLIKNLKADFNVLLGRDGETAFNTMEQISFEDAFSFDELKSEVALMNPAVKLAKSQAKAASYTIKEAQADYFPRVNIFGGYNLNRQQNEVGVVSNIASTGPVFGGSVTWNLFNGFNNQREVQNRRLFFESEEINARQVERETHADLFKAFNDYTFWKQLLDLERFNEVAAREDVRIAKTKLELGGINDIEFRVIQLGALDAEYRLFQAEYRLRMAELELLRISGRLSQMIGKP